MKAKLGPEPSSILISPLRFIGDGILTVPLIRALKRRYPEAQIDLMLPPHLVNLFEQCPYIRDCIVSPKGKWALIRMLHAKKYDWGVVMRRSVSDAACFGLAGVKVRIGYDEQRYLSPVGYQRWGLFLDHVVPFPAVDTDIPQVKTYLGLLPLTEEQPDETLELWADQADYEAVRALIQSHHIEMTKPLAVIHGTSASREKDIAPEKFVPALQYLAQKGFTVMAMGAPGEASFYKQLEGLSGVKIHNLCGLTTLRQTFVMMQSVQLLLSLDSAPIHMAAAAKVPYIVGIYGPTNERQWRPYPYKGEFTPVVNTQLTCRPCVPKLCSHNRCREDLTATQILQAVIDQVALISLKQEAFSETV